MGEEITEQEEDATKKGLSRREALARMGVAVGVVWATPVLTSSRAFAVAGTPNQPQCAGASCATFIPCSSNIDCICVSTVGGGGLCVPGSAQCEPFSPCGAGNVCPSGQVCVVNSCCGDAVCVPLALADQCAPLASGSATGNASRRSTGNRTLGG
jgi:hypothetical protein